MLYSFVITRYRLWSNILQLLRSNNYICLDNWHNAMDSFCIIFSFQSDCSNYVLMFYLYYGLSKYFL